MGGGFWGFEKTFSRLWEDERCGVMMEIGLGTHPAPGRLVPAILVTQPTSARGLGHEAIHDLAGFNPGDRYLIKFQVLTSSIRISTRMLEVAQQ